MNETTFFLDTTREIFEAWLVKTCQAISWATKPGNYHAQHVSMEPHGRVTIAGLLIRTYDKDGVRESYYDTDWYITFNILPLTPERIEVWGSCTGEHQVHAAYLELLAMIGARWPESGLAPAEITMDSGSGQDQDIAARRQAVKKMWNERPPDITTTKFKNDAAEELSVSPSTIRDDLRFLQESGQIE